MDGRIERALGPGFRPPGKAAPIALLIGSAIAVGVFAAPAKRDGTHPSLTGARSVVRLNGDYGERPYRFEGGDAGTVIDARTAIFNVANSRNRSPSAAMPCNAGQLAVNRYPVTISGAARTAFVGGLVRGRVPQASDWVATYCNSSAISFRQSADGVIDGIRIGGAWDAVRASDGSSGLTLRNSWISDVRDDLFENDYSYNAAIYDTLVDGSFQGLSMKRGSRSEHGEASRAIVTISGVLLRLSEYPYKGEMRFGALTKNDRRSPRLRIRNSIVAVDYRGGKTFADYWSRTWDKLAESSGNAFLWLSDAAIPANFPMPPASFTVVKGQAARTLWRAAKTNWINCHPNVARQESDPRSMPRACRADRWGGHGD